MKIKIFTIINKRIDNTYYDLYIISSGSFLVGTNSFRPYTGTWTDDEKLYENSNIDILVKEKEEL